MRWVLQRQIILELNQVPMHEANGGYILIQAKDILQNRFSWEGLKRTITTEELKVENIYSSNLTSETFKSWRQFH